jgi:hypothetical protein
LDPTSDDDLFIKVPNTLAAHNHLPPFDSSPLFNAQDLPILSASYSDFDQLSADLESLSLNPSAFASSHTTPSISSFSPPSQLSPSLPTSSPFIMTTPMPVFGKCAALIFNPRHLNEIDCFFIQLESLFARSTIVLDAEKKKYISVYINRNTAETWEALEEYTDNTKTYHDFKDKLLQLYHQVTLKWILTNLD